MRLIDADNLKVHVGAAVLDGNKEHKDRASALLRAIDRMPIAYDADKVVERLESELNLADKEKERCARENPLQFDTAKGYAYGMSVTLDIVKSGGNR